MFVHLRRCIVVTLAIVGWLLGTAASAAADDPNVSTERAELSDDGVAFALGAEQSEQDAIAAAIEDTGLDLSVLILGEDPDTEPQVLANELRGSDSGTVLVLSPGRFGASSSEFSDSEIERAEDDIGAGDNADAVRDFGAAVTDEGGGVPWVWIIVIVGVAAVGLVIVGRLWEQRRKARAAAAALEAEHDRLRREIDDLGDDIVALDPRVQLIGDEKVRTSYAEASAEYAAIRDRLEQPVTSRGDAKAIAARIAAIKPTLVSVEQAADAAISDES